MKKHFLFLAMAVAAMTSCMKDEVVATYEPTPQAIGFESFVNKATKAVTETNTNLTKFHVFGYYGTTPTTVFDNIPVTYADSKWGYITTQYWTKNTYQFAAYANSNADVNEMDNVTFANKALTISDYTVSDGNDLVADVVADVDGAAKTSSASSPVAFTLEHLLTKVKFTVINNDNTYKMRITSPLTITGVNETGTCTVGESSVSWEGETPIDEKAFTPIAATAAGTYIPIADPANDDHMVASEEYFVMPQELTSIKYSITADFYDNNNQVVATKTFTGVTMINKITEAGVDNAVGTEINTWSNGYAYNYTISLPTAAKPIEFSATVPEWKNGGTIELNPGDDGSNGI